jgi:ascorbate-specific PTS system EIIC-type component UlaA
MFNFLEKNQPTIVGCGFICIGIITLIKKKIQLEGTSHFVSGISACIIGFAFIIIGVFLLVNN